MRWFTSARISVRLAFGFILVTADTGSAATAIKTSADGLSVEADSLGDQVGRFLSQVRSDTGSSRRIAWDSSLSVGVPEIDRQHQEELERLNRFFGRMMEDEGQAAARDMAEAFDSEMRKHFAEEEPLMQRQGNPALNEHRKRHREFLTRLQTTRKALSADDPAAGKPGVRVHCRLDRQPYSRGGSRTGAVLAQPPSSIG